MSLGSTIGELRKARNLTMKDLALMSGVTSSLISQIEHDKANPSINTLLSIAAALDTDVSEFFLNHTGRERESGVVIRANERIPVGISSKKWTQYFLTRENLKALCVSVNKLKPGATTERVPELNPHTQRGYEFGFVLSGKLRVDLDGRTYILNPGDAITFEAERKHVVANSSTGETEILWVVIPGTEERENS